MHTCSSPEAGPEHKGTDVRTAFMAGKVNSQNHKLPTIYEPDLVIGSHRDGSNSDDDIRSGAIDDRLQLLLLGLRHAELVHRLLKVVEKCLPLGGGDHEGLM